MTGKHRILRAHAAAGASAFAIFASAAASAQDAGAPVPTEAVAGAAAPAAAPGAAPPSGGIGDIVVTANKRSQSINSVPLTITAASGDVLIQRGISSTSDLAKIVPGLTAQPSPFNTPVYTLRGVGFYESTLSASPTVAVYTDEVPLPFSAMTKAAALDLERVEVLKGPQGTLFGQNTTGGAINYIAAKPTDHFTAGFDGSYGRFNDVDLQGFVSGPISDTLKGRVAASIQRSDGWQYSITRPGDTLGAIRQGQARILLDWQPSDRLKVSVNVNGWIDQSDSQAPQRVSTYISVPGAPEAAANAAYPYPAQTARAADWSVDIPALRHHDYFAQGAVRADYSLTDRVTLVSISAYERYKTHSFDDFDGTALNVADNQTRGHINTFSQELRLMGKMDHLNWVVGGNFERDLTYDNLIYYFGDSTTSHVGPVHLINGQNFTRQNVTSKAVFGNAEYEVIPNLTLQGGIRYTNTRRTFVGCTEDIPGGNDAEGLQFIETIYRDPSLPFVPAQEGRCTNLDAQFAPTIDPLHDRLNEHNVSWRAGLNYKTPNRGLLYATVSKGYKAGSFPTTSAATSAQYAPVKQESLLAYEIGFKQPLLDRRLQINGAAFYYDYKDKQLRGRELDIVFGPLDALVQVPKSRVWGLEGEVNAQPFPGLTASVAATYLDTKIRDFTGYNYAGVLQNFAGSRFPYAPKLSVVADSQYDWRLNDGLSAFAGASLAYDSATNGSLGYIPEQYIKSYALLDLRAGIKSPDNGWRFEIWGRNVTNTYYWVNAVQTQDFYLRYTGRPATYGASISVRFK